MIFFIISFIQFAHGFFVSFLIFFFSFFFWLFAGKELTQLDVSQNQLQNVPSNAIKNLHHLLILNLNHNRISQIHNRAFEGLDTLEILTLYENKINVIESDAFRGLEKWVILLFWNFSANKRKKLWFNKSFERFNGEKSACECGKAMCNRNCFAPFRRQIKYVNNICGKENETINKKFKENWRLLCSMRIISGPNHTMVVIIYFALLNWKYSNAPKGREISIKELWKRNQIRRTHISIYLLKFTIYMSIRVTYHRNNLKKAFIRWD